MDDPLLRRLGDRHRESTPEDLSADPPSGAAFRRFEGEARERLLERVMAELEGIPAAPTETDDEPVAAGEGRPASNRSARSAWAAGLAAIAAIALGWLVFRQTAVDSDPILLPAYSVTQFEGGVSPVRSSDVPRPQVELKPTSHIALTVTPETSVRSAVGLVLLATSESGDVVLVRPRDTQVSATGSLRLEGPLSDFIELPPGHHELQLIIADPDALPESAAAARADGPWRRLSMDVIIVAE